MNNRPKIMISVFIFNSDGTKILVGKRYDEGTWGVVTGNLEFGEGFEDCAGRLLCNTTNILIEDPERLKFICTYNVAGKTKKLHIVAVDFYMQITKEEEKYHLMVDPYYYQNWNWYSYEEILKMHDNLFCVIQVFLKKFNIKQLEDIKKIVSN